MKPEARILAGCLALFLAANFLVGAFSRDPLEMDAALAACREKGWKNGDLGLSKSEVSVSLPGKSASIELKSKGLGGKTPKTFPLALSEPLNLAPWHVVAYKEEPPEP